MAATTSAQADAKCTPAAVATEPDGPRSSSWTPSWRSSFCSLAVADGCVRPWRTAAFDTLPELDDGEEEAQRGDVHCIDDRHGVP